MTAAKRNGKFVTGFHPECIDAANAVISHPCRKKLSGQDCTIENTWDRPHQDWNFVCMPADAGRQRFAYGCPSCWRSLSSDYTPIGSLVRQARISAHEAIGCGLLNPQVPADAEAECISKPRLIAQQRRYNPLGWVCLTEDKSVFYAYCASVGLAVPAMYAVFDVPNGWSSTGEILRERKDWERFFDDGLPDEFIVKPVEGVYGHAVNAYKRTAGGFLDTSGVNYTASTLYEALRTDGPYRRFVIQERLRNHVDLERLSGTAAVQCARLVTWLRTNGDVEIYLTFFKIIVGASVTDNYDYGRTGNLKANISVKDGTLGPAIGGAPGGVEFRIVATHPKTGISFLNFKLPYWHDAQQLVCRAARLFSPLRTIGWDVALTPLGPILLEGNVWWDPSNDLVIGPQAADCRRGGMAILLKRFEDPI